jgi:hypothetical protein
MSFVKVREPFTEIHSRYSPDRGGVPGPGDGGNIPLRSVAAARVLGVGFHAGDELPPRVRGYQQVVAVTHRVCDSGLQWK